MKSATLSRRLLSAAAGLALGTVGAIALTTPAQADGGHGSDLVDFWDNCDGTYVYVESPARAGLPWLVTAGDQTYWPEGDDDGIIPAGESEVILVPGDAGEISVDAAESPKDWPLTHTWEQPAFCDRLPGPDVMQPSCDTDGEIAIPAVPEPTESPDPTLPELPELPELPNLPDLPAPPDIRTMQTTDSGTAEIRAGYSLDGNDVDFGSTHAVEPGTHTVSFGISGFGDAAPMDRLVLKTWTLELEEPECDDGGEGGEGGELPMTGSSTLLIAGGAIALLALGSGLYLTARRRRTSFTA